MFEKTKRRRSLRLQGYDYARAGAYFVTICTKDRACLFGDIVAGEMVLNDAGKMVETVWHEIPKYYPGIDIDEFQIMPNHIHGIIIIVGAGPRACPNGPRACPDDGQPRGQGQPQGVAPTMSLPDVVHRFKTMTTNKYIRGVKQQGWPRFNGKLWQRNYWEHIVRNDGELDKIREYIINNPAQWAIDRENPNVPVGAGPCACPKGPRACPNGPRACPDDGQPRGQGQPQGVDPTMSLPEAGTDGGGENFSPRQNRSNGSNS